MSNEDHLHQHRLPDVARLGLLVAAPDYGVLQLMASYRVTLERYIDQGLYNGPWQPFFVGALSMSKAGCPYRGTSVCTRCPLSPPVLCEYQCTRTRQLLDCEHRGYCKCGHDQTERLRAWGLIA